MIFYILTLMAGWWIVGLVVNVLIFLLGFPPEIKTGIFAYILVGYVVMAYCKIKTPLSEKAIKDYKGVEFKLFLKDLYYAAWWPYYIWNH